MAATQLSLDDILGGSTPLNDDPSIMERPSYKRDGLYGKTPFTPKPARLVAHVMEQVCSNCAGTARYFGGIFREFPGRAVQGDIILKNLINGATSRDKIEEVLTIPETVPYCPNCLGEAK